MPKNHRCQGSDHISKVAEDEGFRDWQTVWDANAQLKTRRSNPNVLFKGDRVSQGDTLRIPDVAERDEGGATEQHHPFVTRSNTVFLRMRILNDDFTAIAGASYSLTVVGAAAPLTGTTDASGQFEREIPRTAQQGVLTVRIPAAASDPPPATGAPVTPTPDGAVRGDVPVTWQLQIGSLNPIMESAPDRWCISGVQQRFNNLAINTGPVDGILGPNTDKAVRAFQHIFKLEEDGKPGQIETQPKLVQVHDQPDSVLGPVPVPAPAPAGT